MKFWLTDGVFHRECTREKSWDQSSPLLYQDTGTCFEIPDDAEKVIVPYGAKEIGEECFSHCCKLIAVVLPEGLEVIGRNAFSYSTIRSISIPGSVKKICNEGFKDCTKLEELVLPEGLEEIGESAFSYTAIRRISIPASVKQIPRQCFFHCAQLKELMLPEGLEGIGYRAFSGTAVRSIRIPSSVKYISGFSNCSKLEELVLPEGPECICQDAFSDTAVRSIRIPGSVKRLSGFDGCSKLEEVVLQEGLVEIKGWAFSGTAIRSIRIPGSVKRISRNCFKNCAQLEELVFPDGREEMNGDLFSDEMLSGTLIRSINIPSSVKKIGEKCFSNCAQLEEVVLHEGLEEIGKSAFSGTAIRSINIPGSVKRLSGFGGCSRLEEVVLQEGLEEIGELAFSGTAIRSINIPGSVKKIGDRCFRDCAQLEEIVLHEGPEEIGKSAFSGTAIHSVRIPGSVRKIGDRCFRDCAQLEEIVLHEGLEEIGKSAFSGTAIRSINIPGSVRKIGESCFKNCAQLEEVVLEDGLEEIGESAFSGTAIHSVRIPGSVRKIGESCFKNCAQLEKLELAEGLEEIGGSAFEGFGALRELTLPATLLGLGSRAFAECTALRKVVIRGRAAGFDRKAFQKCPAIREAWIPRDQLMMAKPLFRTRVRLFDLDGNSFEGEYDREFGPSTAHSPRDQEVLDMVAESIDPRTLIGWALKQEFPWDTLTGVRYADSADYAPKETVMFILYAYISQASNIHRHKSKTEIFELQLSPAADAIAAMLDHARLMDALTDICCPGCDGDHAQPTRLSPAQALQMEKNGASGFQLDRVYGYFKTPEYMYPYCRYADAEDIRSLIDIARNLSDYEWYTTEQKSAFYYRSAVLLSDTKEARNYADKISQLKLYARMRGKTPEQMYLDEAKDKGLNPDGSMDFELGNDAVHIVARLTDELKFVLFDVNAGKELKSFPKKGIDSQLRDAEVARYKDMKQTIRQTVKKYIPLLQKQYNSGSLINHWEWKKLYLNDPILNRLAQLIVWQQGRGERKTYFTLRQGQAVNADGTVYAFTCKPVWLAHPVEMNEEEIGKWQRWLLDRGLKQPFPQVLWEPVVHWQSRDLDTYYKGVVLSLNERNALKASLRKRGIEVSMDYEEYDFNHRKNEHEFSNKGHMSLGDVLYFDIELDPDSRSITLGGAWVWRDASPRELNSVLIELDRVTVSAHVANDNVDALTDELLQDFTAAQLAEFTELSIEKKAVNCTARLLDYKHKRFPEYANLTGFTLDW